MRRLILFSISILLAAILLLPRSTHSALPPATLRLKICPASFALEIDGKLVATKSIGAHLALATVPSGKHQVRISSAGYRPKELTLSLHGTISIEEKLEKASAFLTLVGEIRCGSNPKSVEFTPDGKAFVVALLGGNGVEVFSADSLKKILTVDFPEPYRSKSGFVEVAFVKRLNELWVSQMTTASVHAIDLTTYAYKNTFSTEGIWSKVITISDDEKLAFVSNWSSRDISVVNVDSHKVIRKVKMKGIPRGMVITPSNKTLYACIFDSCLIRKVNVETGTVEKSLRYGTGAARHAAMDHKKERLYFSDMARGSVLVISTKNDSLLKEIKVGKSLNTIKLTSDGRFLFVSSRGANGAEGYYKKGAAFGKVFVIDTEKLEVVEWIWGRNQPTGLAISPDDSLLAFTDFLDNRVEVYRITKSEPVVKSPR